MNQIPRITLLLYFFALMLSPSLYAAEVIGTIKARLDGEILTWYVLQPEGDSQVSSMWMARGPDSGQAVISGYETKKISFKMDPLTGVMVASGIGSAITISFRFPIGATDVDHRLPAMGDDPAAVMLQPAIGDYENMLGFDEGRVHVSTIDASKDGKQASFAGSISGSLRSINGSSSIELTEGEFEVHDVRFFAPQ